MAKAKAKKAGKTAKAKTGKKTAPKAKAGKKTAPRAGKAAKKRVLKQPALPGTEGVRNKALDLVCEGFADVRAQRRRIDDEETDLKRRALKEMQGKKIPAYNHGGIKLATVPGDVKLSVRVAKDENTNADPLEDAEETGSGQDAGEIAEALTDKEADEIANAAVDDDDTPF